jgi:hypothetical protein
MSRSLQFIAHLLLSALAAGPAPADEARARRYELPNLDTLERTLPAGWLDSIDAPPGGVPLTIELRPAAGPRFEVFVTPEWQDPAAPDVRDAEALRNEVQDLAGRVQPQAIERRLEIQRLQGEQGVGFYFAAIDRAAAPDEFQSMHQGALLIGDLTLWFTILTHVGQDGVVADALAMLQSAVHRSTGADQR